VEPARHPLLRHPFLGHPEHPSDRSGPLAFAHRGGSLGGPQNSLPAFERAVGLGYRHLETDVRTTSDGALVAFQDSRLERATDSGGAVDELPWRTVRTARLAGRERIPLLEELLDAFPDTRFAVDLRTDAAVRPCVAAVRRTGAWDRVCATSSSDARLAAARAAAGPRLALALGRRAMLGLRLRSLPGVPAAAPVDRILGRALRRGAVCVQVPAGMADRRFVRLAHRLGLQAHVRSADDRREIGELLDLGVDGLIADRIDVLRAALRSRGLWAGQGGRDGTEQDSMEEAGDRRTPN
jgi:glycerophosphoryl diester phosphodiesterase